MNKKPLLAMSCAAVIAGALPLFAQTLDWTNAGGDRLWNNPLNWNPQAVPAITNAVTVGATATPTSPVLLAAAPGACNNLTLNGTGGGSLEVATNLTIGGTLLRGLLADQAPEFGLAAGRQQRARLHEAQGAAGDDLGRIQRQAGQRPGRVWMGWSVIVS